MITPTRRPLTLTAAAALALACLGTAPSVVASAAPTPGPAAGLPLGPESLPEQRVTRTLQPGVTFTSIDRGAPDASVPWVVELNIPTGETSPDPDAPARSVQDRASADKLVTELTGAGFNGQAQPVVQPRVADVAGGVIGYRVRLTDAFAGKAEADAAVKRVKDAGFSAKSWYSGWDGGTEAAGHWKVNVLTIDPNSFKGRLLGSYGPDLERRETVSELARQADAVAAVNAGFFTMDPKAGAEGDPAGIAVYQGKTESEPVANRPALVLREDARGTRVTRPSWSGRVSVRGDSVALDGRNRVPGLIRNCGGDATDLPTALPRHDVTCTDPDEVVAFDPAFGASTPTGPGAEAVLDAHGAVLRVQQTRGVALAEGEQSLQGIGNRADFVSRLRPGQHVSVHEKLNAGTGITPRSTVINGGPQLLQSGRVHITQATDGMAQVANPSFDYGWVLQRNPRTFAGVDGHGRTVLVTVDGRQPDQLGLSIPETAEVARALGLREAINLDGGGSTAMSVDGSLVNSPSDTAGERPVGDAIVIG